MGGQRKTVSSNRKSSDVKSSAQPMLSPQVLTEHLCANESSKAFPFPVSVPESERVFFRMLVVI